MTQGASWPARERQAAQTASSCATTTSACEHPYFTRGGVLAVLPRGDVSPTLPGCARFCHPHDAPRPVRTILRERCRVRRRCARTCHHHTL